MRGISLACLALLCGACSFTTPPIDTPKSASTFTLGDLWPDAPPSTLIAVPVPVNLPPYRVKESEGGIAIDVPAQAQAANLTTAVLHVELKSEIRVNLGFKLYLAKEQPYATTPIGTTSIGPGETRQVDAALDTALLKASRVFAGVEAQILQSEDAIVRKTDPLTATTWCTVQVKVF